MKKTKTWVIKVKDYITGIDRKWLITWGLVWVSFVSLDFYFQFLRGEIFIGVTALKYSGVVLCFIYARKKFAEDYLLQIALLFTMLADTILMLNSVSEVGVLVFCMAQYFHIARFAGTGPLFFLGWNVLIIIFLFLGQSNNVPDMYILASIYFISLLCNIILTGRWWRRSKQGLVAAPVSEEGVTSTNTENQTDKRHFIRNIQKRYLNLPPESREREIVASTCAFIGFILFLCCDLNVMCSYFSVTGVLSSSLTRYFNFFAWVFYYPSQVLISNSSIIFSKSKRRKS